MRSRRSTTTTKLTKPSRFRRISAVKTSWMVRSPFFLECRPTRPRRVMNSNSWTKTTKPTPSKSGRNGSRMRSTGRKAKLILDREMCLPLEVHLFNAAGTTETVYLFSDLQVNKIRIFFWTNPFQPSLTFEGYRRSVHNNPVAGGPQGPLGQGAASVDPIAANRMPSLIGRPYKPVKAKLESLGYTVKLLRGDPATAPGQVFHVEHQEPPPNAPLDKDSPIILTLYVQMPPPDEIRSRQIAGRPDGQQTDRSVRSEQLSAACERRASGVAWSRSEGVRSSRMMCRFVGSTHRSERHSQFGAGIADGRTERHSSLNRDHRAAVHFSC